MARRTALPVVCLVALLATALAGCGRDPVQTLPVAAPVRVESPCAILGRRVYVADTLPDVGHNGYTDVATLLSGPVTRAVLGALPDPALPDGAAPPVASQTEQVLRIWLVLLGDDLERLADGDVPADVAKAARTLARADTEPAGALAEASQVIRIFKAGRCP